MFLRLGTLSSNVKDFPTVLSSKRLSLKVEILYKCIAYKKKNFAINFNSLTTAVQIISFFIFLL